MNQQTGTKSYAIETCTPDWGWQTEQAREYVASHEDDDDMDEDELADVFVQVYGRKPDAKDRRDGVWSLICAGI